MSTVKRTYALPEDTVYRFEEAVPPGHRSAFLASLINNWVEEQRRTELARLVVEGCREMAGTYLEMEREFHPLEEEVARVDSSEPRTR